MVLNETNFFFYLNSLKCFEKNPHVAVGVSGGPDSIALVYLAHRWIKKKQGKLIALIFDHQLRSNSKQESHQVKKNLKELGINSIILKSKINNPIKKNMAQARKNRFVGLINFCKKNNILNLFLGHHFDDNLETFLIRKINGSNFEGLGSIKEISYFDKIQILRPLLNVNKTSIIKFNNKNKLVYLNDPSNQDMNYTRVKVRNFLLDNKYKKMAIKDFISIKKNMHIYKDMIWIAFIDVLIDANSKNIKINMNLLIKFDNLIIEKIILLSLKFFSDQNFKVRSSKINLFINQMKKPDFKIFNLSGILIKKRSKYLIFSKK